MTRREPFDGEAMDPKPYASPYEYRVKDTGTGGEKGRKLARFELLPEDALWSIAEHFGRGAGKYEDRNWERGYDYSLSYGALRRHLAAWWQGEDDDHDPVFGAYNHLDAVGFHALVLRTFVLRGVGTDDRPGGPRWNRPSTLPFSNLSD